MNIDSTMTATLSEDNIKQAVANAVSAQVERHIPADAVQLKIRENTVGHSMNEAIEKTVEAVVSVPMTPERRRDAPANLRDNY